MNARLLLEIALRLFGLGFVFLAGTDLISVLPYFISSYSASPVPDLLLVIAVNLVPLVIRILCGGALVFCAPYLAAWFYPTGSNDGELQTTVGPGDVYRTACFVLGVYLLVQSATPVTQLVISGFRGFSGPDQMVTYAVSATVSLVTGLLLVFGSRKIAELLSNLRYNPDTIPAQRFSIAVLLVVILLVAVVFGILQSRMN